MTTSPLEQTRNNVMENPDLTWDLTHFNHRKHAIEFIQQFEQTFCVYSSNLKQMYSNYNLYLPKQQDRKLVILPDPTAYHDTFSGIPAECVKKTGLYIIPGALVNKTGSYLTNISNDQELGRQQIPLKVALKKLMEKTVKTDPFLPVLSKGDLREFNEKSPILHLHRLKIFSEHMLLSEYDQRNIQKTILKKLHIFLDSE